MIKLSGYKIIKKIGSGGMGDVYLAEHEKLEKKVAIKSLHKNLATDSSFRERFSQEAKTHSKLDHPNIVKLLDYKESKDGLFLIMEYVDGKQLDEHIKKVTGPIPEKELTTLFIQILDAIGYAHEEGLVHRDIKPSNIMIDRRGRIKVLDFGIAKMQEEDKGLTKTGIQIGTAAYMSPEQVNAKKVNKLTDIYSLGVTLFYMAVGKPPYDGETNTFSIQEKIVHEPFPIASKVYHGVSERFEETIKKATQKNKKDRYQSCEDFNDDLNAIKKDKEIVKEDTNSLKDILKRKLYLIILVIFSILYVVTSIIDNNAYRPEFLLSEFTVIAAFFVLVTLFSIKAVSRKYKLKKIIAREILYLICSFILAVIMFGIHSYVYNSYDETISEIEGVISGCDEFNNVIFSDRNNINYLSKLGFKPVEKEYYISDNFYLNKHVKSFQPISSYAIDGKIKKGFLNDNGTNYSISNVTRYADDEDLTLIEYFKSKTSFNSNTAFHIPGGIIFITNEDLSKFRQEVGKDRYDRIIDQIGGFTQLSSITNNSSNSIFFNDLEIAMDRSNYILGTIKLKKKKPFYESYLRIIPVGEQTTHSDVEKYGIPYSSKTGWTSYNDKGIWTHYIQSYSDEYGAGNCYYDKKKNVFVKTNFRNRHERNTYGKTGLGCSTWLCGSKKVRDDYYMKYTPSNILESPAIIDVDDFDKRYSTSLYKKENIITLEKSDWRGAINTKKDKIEASITGVEPSLFDGGDGDWSLIILFLAYVYRAIISIITGIIFFIRWLIRTSISN